MKKPILAIWDRGNRGFEEQCEQAVKDGYLLWSMRYVEETENVSSAYTAFFILPTVKTANKDAVARKAKIG
jgi:hypothetical protein